MGKRSTALLLLMLATSCGGQDFETGPMETTAAEAGTLDVMHTEPSPSPEAATVADAGAELVDAGPQTPPDAPLVTSAPDVGAELVDAGAPAWSGSEDVYYHVGDVVSYQGHLWRCIEEHASRPDWYPGAPSLPVLWAKL